MTLYWGYENLTDYENEFSITPIFPQLVHILFETLKIRKIMELSKLMKKKKKYQLNMPENDIEGLCLKIYWKAHWKL